MKRVLDTYQLVTNGDMSADITSETFEIQAYYGFAIWYEVSAGTSPSGNLIFQFSLDGTNWNPVTSIFNTVAISADTSAIFMTQSMVPAKYFRVFYDVTSGSGTLNVKVSGVRI